MLLLLLAPAGLVYVAGFNAAAHYVGIGTLLAMQLSVLARPVAAFSVLLPLVYAAAAVTAQSTDGVVALNVALAAAVGAASSQGLHRGLLALLAAALLGSFEPAQSGEVLTRAGFLLAGSTYGFLMARTVLGRVDLPSQPVHAQSALGYAVLLASITLVAWFAARYAGFPHPWWLPLAFVAASDPAREGTARQALLRSVLVATAAMLLVFVTDAFDAPLVRAALLLLTLLLALTAAARRPALQAMLFVPMLVLVSSHAAVHDAPLAYLFAVLPAFAAVVAVSALGHWLLWTLRSDSGRVMV